MASSSFPLSGKAAAPPPAPLLVTEFRLTMLIASSPWRVDWQGVYELKGCVERESGQRAVGRGCQRAVLMVLVI